MSVKCLEVPCIAEHWGDAWLLLLPFQNAVVWFNCDSFHLPLGCPFCSFTCSVAEILCLSNVFVALGRMVKAAAVFVLVLGKA